MRYMPTAINNYISYLFSIFFVASINDYHLTINFMLYCIKHSLTATFVIVLCYGPLVMISCFCIFFGCKSILAQYPCGNGCCRHSRISDKITPCDAHMVFPFSGLHGGCQAAEK